VFADGRAEISKRPEDASQIFRLLKQEKTVITFCSSRKVSSFSYRSTMQLQAAAVILAQSLAVPLVAGASASLPEKRRRLLDGQQRQAYHQVSNERLQVPNEAVEGSQGLSFLKKRSPKRQSIDLKDYETGRECDPAGAAKEELEADLGFCHVILMKSAWNLSSPRQGEYASR
jgi:hypothetical protein